MPEPRPGDESGAARGAMTLAAAARADKPPDGAAEGAAARDSKLFYGLGLSLQIFLWFLLFLALVIAVAVGGELTEFRYVGF